MARVNHLGDMHHRTTRDYRERANSPDRARCMEVAKRFGEDYWDGDRKYGYGGYRYDGRWAPIAERLVEYYGLMTGSRVLDVGCGKGHLLFELVKLVPGIQVWGLDPSRWGVECAPAELNNRIYIGAAQDIIQHFSDMDLVISLAALHNLKAPDLMTALQGIEKTSRRNVYITLESWNNEQERCNLLDWQLTCESFHDIPTWETIFTKLCPKADWEFLTFP